LKQIFKEVEEQHNERFAKDLMELEDNLRKKFEGQSMKFYKFSPDDEKALADAGKQADQAWIQEIMGRGAPAQQTWDNFQRLNKACMDDVAARGYPWSAK